MLLCLVHLVKWLTDVPGIRGWEPSRGKYYPILIFFSVTQKDAHTNTDTQTDRHSHTHMYLSKTRF